MNCFVYVLGTDIAHDPRTYIGWTTDLARRLEEHNAGTGAKATRAVGTARQSSTLWQVVAVVTGTDGRSYAKLTQVSDPTLTKTVTTDAVLDGSMYERVV